MKGLNKEIIVKGLNGAVNIIKKGSTIVGPVLAVVMFDDRMKRMLDKMKYMGDVSYGDAFKVIMDSDMLSSYKREAVSLMKKDQDSDYYKAVMYAVNSQLLSSDKLNLIRTLNGKVNEEESQA